MLQVCASCCPTVSIVAYCVLSLRHLFSVLISWHQETEMPPHFTFKIHWSIRSFTDSRFTLVICGICCFATRCRRAEHKGWRRHSWADGDSSSRFPLSCFTLQLTKITFFFAWKTYCVSTTTWRRFGHHDANWQYLLSRQSSRFQQ